MHFFPSSLPPSLQLAPLSSLPPSGAPSNPWATLRASQPCSVQEHFLIGFPVCAYTCAGMQTPAPFVVCGCCVIGRKCPCRPGLAADARPKSQYPGKARRCPPLGARARPPLGACHAVAPRGRWVHGCAAAIRGRRHLRAALVIALQPRNQRARCPCALSIIGITLGITCIQTHNDSQDTGDFSISEGGGDELTGSTTDNIGS